MAAFSPATHKVVTASSANPKDDLPVDARVMLARLFSDMGVFQVTAGNTAPADTDVLWWHIDVKQFKRYDAVLANWYPIVANQIAMHIIRRAVLGSVQDTNLETGDLFCFWDVSLGDLKKISRNDLMAALGSVRTLTTNEGIQGGGNLSADRTLKLDVNGLTAKATPLDVDLLAMYSIADGAHRKVTQAALKSAIRGPGTLQGIWMGNAITGVALFSADLTWTSYDGSVLSTFAIAGGSTGKTGVAICVKMASGATTAHVSNVATNVVIETAGSTVHTVLYFIKN